MINCEKFYNKLVNKNINFFTGVPDSLLKDFCAYITDNTDSKNNIIAANEGNAIALASGYYLATGKIGLVYMQNSGLGNAINPLTSLVDPEVYSIPMLLLIGWRGEPDMKKDEPQHIKQGKITLKLLDTLGIKYSSLPNSMEKANEVIDDATNYMKSFNAPYAIVVSKETFEHYNLKNEIITKYELSREEAIKLIVDKLDKDYAVISTTGMTSRELFEYREELGQGHSNDFLTVGSMGHSSQIALGVALSKPDKQVYCLDGDGAVIMHMGALAIIGSQSLKNFKHIVVNNGAHDSVGGQPTVAFKIDIPSIASACGYKLALSAETRNEFMEKLSLIKSSEGPCLLEVKVNKGHRNNLGRPTATPIENKKKFMDFLNNH